MLSIANDERAQLQQLLAIFAVGSSAAVTQDNPFLEKHQKSLPKDVLAAITVISSIEKDAFDAVLHHGSVEQLTDLQSPHGEKSFLQYSNMVRFIRSTNHRSESCPDPIAHPSTPTR